MTLNNRGKAVLHRLIRKGFAGLMIAGSFTVAGLPWTLGAGFGPPAWIAAHFIKHQHADCALPQESARSTVSVDRHSGSQGRIQARTQGWWL